MLSMARLLPCAAIARFDNGRVSIERPSFVLRNDLETAWKHAKAKALEPISLHECRHTFASLMIAAGVNAKALSTYMGTRASRSRSTATAT
jgi:integrase